MIRLHQVVALAVVVFCAGCGTCGHQLFGVPRAYGGVRADWRGITSGGACLVLDLPFSAVADTFFLPVDLANQPPRQDPLEGWTFLRSTKNRSYHPDKIIADDLQGYIDKQKFPYPPEIAFHEDGTGQHAVRLDISFGGYHRRYILFYDKSNVRTKTMKFVVGRYMC